MSNCLDEFERIIEANYTEKELTGMAKTDEMPAITPGEGGVFGLAALLIGAGLTANLTEHVQLVAIAGGVLLGVAGALTHSQIRVARNNHAAIKAASEADVQSALAYANGEEDED